jgi:hypothetical protein
MTFSADEVSAMVIRDLLTVGKTSTMIAGNSSIYDYDPEEKIVKVEVL